MVHLRPSGLMTILFWCLYRHWILKIFFTSVPTWYMFVRNCCRYAHVATTRFFLFFFIKIFSRKFFFGGATSPINTDLKLYQFKYVHTNKGDKNTAYEQVWFGILSTNDKSIINIKKTSYLHVYQYTRIKNKWVNWSMDRHLHTEMLAFTQLKYM